MTALLISFGEYFKPLYGFLFHHLAFFNAFRVPVMILILLQFSVALLSARGIYALIGKLTMADRAGMVRRMWIAAGISLGLTVVVALGQGGWAAHYQELLRQTQSSLNPSVLDALTENARHHFQDDLVKVGATVVLGFAALALLGRGTLHRNVFWAVMMTLLVFDLWRVDYRILMPPQQEIDQGLHAALLVPKAEQSLKVSEPDEAIRYLMADRDLYRIFPTDEFMDNRYSGFGIASIGGYNPAKPKIYDDVLQAQLQGNPRFWIASNVKYLVTKQDFGPGGPLPAPGLGRPLIMRKVQDGAARIYRVEPSQPRAWMVGKARALAGKAALDAYGDSTFDPASEVILEQLSAGDLGPQQASRVRVPLADLNAMTIEADAASPGYLVVSELYYPDWKARVDGRETPILKADGFLRAVRLLRGHHRVEMRFESKALRTGLKASAAALAVILALLLLPAGLARLQRRAGARP